MSGCVQSICLPDFVPDVPPSPLTPFTKTVPILTAEAIQPVIEKIGKFTFTTTRNAGEDSIQTLSRASGDSLKFIRKAGEDTVITTYKATKDVSVTYIKSWRDAGEQGKRSFSDAVDAGKAAVHYTENQLKSNIDVINNASKRLREGKIIDAMWGIGVEPLQANEANFAKATQESEVINTAAASAAATYGGPGGAAAYAAWSTYRRTGNADMAFRAGLLAAATSQMGSSVAKLPSGTTGEIIKKAALAGAAGGISIAAAGGDEQSIRDGFLKSAGAVLIRAGSDKIKSYSPDAKNAYETVECISAKDTDCLSKTTWARNARGQIKSSIKDNFDVDPEKIDPNKYVGKWTGFDPKSAEGRSAAIIAQTSKIYGTNAIPLINNKWILTWTIGDAKEIKYGSPKVVLTFVGVKVPFLFSKSYGDLEKNSTIIGTKSVPINTPLDIHVKPSQIKRTAVDTPVYYYAKPADGVKIMGAFAKNFITYSKLDYVGPQHERTLTNAMICGQNTPIRIVKKVALSLIDAGVDLKYVGTNSSIKQNQILVLNLLNDSYTLNTSNISRGEILGISKCPDKLIKG